MRRIWVITQSLLIVFAALFGIGGDAIVNRGGVMAVVLMIIGAIGIIATLIYTSKFVPEVVIPENYQVRTKIMQDAYSNKANKEHWNVVMELRRNLKILMGIARNGESGFDELAHDISNKAEITNNSKLLKKTQAIIEELRIMKTHSGSAKRMLIVITASNIEHLTWEA